MRLFITFLFIGLWQITFAQTSIDIEKLKSLRLACLDENLSADLLIANNALFKRELKLIIEKNKSQKLQFDSIPFFAHLKSTDNQIEILNWNINFSDGSFEYFGFVIHKGFGKVFEMTDKSDEYLNPETKKMKHNNWFGALYYEIVTVKSKPNYYVLLGWDGNNNYTTKKIIETLSFENESINFGIPVFESENGTINRVIFEFSKSAVMSLRYQEKEKRIVFDHLAPFQDGADDFFEFYGPDLSFDAYQLKKRNWSYIEDIDVRAPNKMDNYIDPRKTRK